MKTNDPIKSRQNLKDRFLRTGTLPGHRTYVSNCTSITLLLTTYLLVTLSAFVPVSCRHDDIVVIPEPSVPVDSALNRLRFRAGDGLDIEQALILVYSTESLCALDTMIRLDYLPEELVVKLAEGEKYVAAIINSPVALSTAALSRYDYLDQLRFDFEDDSPDTPLMGARDITSGNFCELTLSPIMCRVELAAISNTLDDYELLEEPRIRLVDLNASIGLFEEDPVYPSETLDAGEWVSLPYDIGMYTQYPGTALYCYPNGTPETTLGSAHTALELETTVLGKLCSYEVSLPAFGRGDTVRVELTINGQRDFSWSVDVVNAAKYTSQ